MPTCNVDVEASLGGSGVVRWTGTCLWNSDSPSGTQDFDDDHQMTWLRDESGQVVIDVYRKSDKKYDRWAVNNCKSPDTIGGSQCVPTGGGCVSGSLDFLDISNRTNPLRTGHNPSPLECPGLKR